MWWRLPAAAWRARKGAGNRRALNEIVRRGPPPGLLGYHAGEPVGWCALAPRAAYPRLAASRLLKAVDAQPVWSVTCFFVVRAWRGRGVTGTLLEAAKDFARQHGAQMLEGYPVDPGGRAADVFVFTGLASVFRRAGFVDVARRSPTRPVLRCALS